MERDNISPAMQAYLGAWEILRRLGFSRDELRCQISCMEKGDRQSGLLLSLETQGKRFLLEIGQIAPEDIPTFADEFRRVTQAWDAGRIAPGEIEQMVRASKVWPREAGLAEAIVAKGFVLPAKKEEWN